MLSTLTRRAATAVAALTTLAVLGVTGPAHASEAALTVDVSCTGIVTATATVVSTEGVTGRIDGWWGAALGKPATDTRITLHYPAGTQVTIGVNMTLSTGAPSSAVATVTVPPPCPTTTVPAPTTTPPATTVPPATTTTAPPLPDPTTTVPPAATTTSWPGTRPTVDLDGRKRPTTTVPSTCPPGETETLIGHDDRLPTDVTLPGSGDYVRCVRTELPRTGMALGWWLPGIAAVLILLGLGLVLESRGWRNGGRR